MIDHNSNYQYWLQHVTDTDVKKSLLQMQGNQAEIWDAFHQDMEFGTAGLRGVMSAGTNRMNIYTLYKATYGVAKYMQMQGMHSCAITYDSRNNSQRFAQVCAATLAEQGIKVYLTAECMPTPYLSFLVRYYGCDMGINITASHNAAQYNGYKVYDSDGCQLTDVAAGQLTEIISKVDTFAHPVPEFSRYKNGLIVYTDQQAEQAYKNCVIAQSLNDASGIKVVYSPLNGAGYRVVPDVLRQVGLTDLTVVPEQSMPDGNFPTCPYPNPEMAQTLDLSIKLATQLNADAVIANDPDSDRLGVAILGKNDFQLLTGNEVGLLLCDYILTAQKQRGTLPKNGIIVKTIVSTPMVDALAKMYGVQVVDVLTGFKYIGNEIKKLENINQTERFLFGFEESCGYLKGSYVRDKDGVVAAMLVAQCVAYYKQHGKTMLERLEELKNLLGNYVQKTFRYTFDGEQGIAQKERVFAQLRQQPLLDVGGSQIVTATDYLTQTQWDLPKSNVLRYKCADGTQLILRPSGTEPLVKAYVCVVGTDRQVDEKFTAIKTQLDKIMQ